MGKHAYGIKRNNRLSERFANLGAFLMGLLT